MRLDSVRVMQTLEVHFDGRVLVPHGPVNLPIDQTLAVSVLPVQRQMAAAGEIDECDWRRGATASLTDFLRKEPDLYTSTDGRPFGS